MLLYSAIYCLIKLYTAQQCFQQSLIAIPITLATDNLLNNNLYSTTGRKSGKDICAEAQMLANPLLKLQLKDEKQNAGRIKYSGM
jgi:hypothetical protein